MTSWISSKEVKPDLQKRVSLVSAQTLWYLPVLVIPQKELVVNREPRSVNFRQQAHVEVGLNDCDA